MLYAFDHQQLADFPSFASGEPTDEELMARIQAQDETALAALLRRHTPLLRTIVARVVNNDFDVDDLMQEIFFEIWRQADRYDAEKGKALGWIVTLSRRRAIDRLRKKQAYFRAEERLRVETENAPAPVANHGADEDAIASDTTEIFNRVLATLPDAQREALHLAYYRGLSQREIAAQTGIPLGTIKTRLELAVRKVRNAILALGGSEEWAVARA
jgi:RNA polymerase sigma-70 factor (ECF subfamily)